MSMTRREWCSMLPALVIPAIPASGASAEQDAAMPSAMYPFEKLAVRTPGNVEVRNVLKRDLTQRRIAGSGKVAAVHRPVRRITAGGARWLGACGEGERREKCDSGECTDAHGPRLSPPDETASMPSSQ